MYYVGYWEPYQYHSKMHGIGNNILPRYEGTDMVQQWAILNSLKSVPCTSKGLKGTKGSLAILRLGQQANRNTNKDDHRP